MPEVHHVRAFFSGRVQGVGFRYQSLQVAREFDVSGWVQNLPDGRVLLEAEGARGEVHDFIAAVQERLASYIRKSELTATSRAPQCQGFVIR
jgi:acylphosphatase